MKVPSLNKDTVITAYYGNATPDAVTASEVWSNGYVGVWHLNETAVPLAESSGKSTPFVNNGTYTNKVMFAASGVAGGRSVSFYENESYTNAAGIARLVADDDDDLDGFDSFTVEYWTFPKENWDGGTGSGIVGKREASFNTNPNASWFCQQNRTTDSSNFKSYCSWSTNSTIVLKGAATSDTAPEFNTWNYQTFVRDVKSAEQANLQWYLNGSPDGSKKEDNPQTVNSGDATLWLGGGPGPRIFLGSIDEVRISTVARSADWVKASHDCVTEEGFATFGVMEGDNDWTKYSHRFRVTFSGYTGSETLTNFPVLVKISESGVSGFRYADCQKPGGADLRFADADGNLLASEVDTWNTNGVSLVWVKVPSLTVATKITAYYGWDLAPVVDSSAVWTGNGYVGVWHLNESALPLAESSGVSSPFTEGSYPQYVDYGASGIIGKSVDFGSYTNNYAGFSRLEAADDDGHLSGFTNFTVECWTCQTRYWESGNSYAGIVSKGELNDRTWKVCQECSANNYSLLEFVDADGNRASRVKSLSAAPSGEWTHQTFIRNKTGSNECLLYFNGEVVGRQNDTRTSFKSSTVPLVLGGGGGGTSRVFPGSIDEVRISNVARSVDWVKASHDTVNGSSPFATYSSAGENVDAATIISFR